MKILVFSHKPIWKSEQSPSGWATDGGFVFHMMAISSLFSEMELMTLEVPGDHKGEIYFKDPNLIISPIRAPKHSGIKRKLSILWLGIRKMPYFISKIKESDIVHTPIPSDFGTIGMMLAWWLKKPLFIRHCGNWKNERTIAERFWKQFLIKNAGNQIAALATGGGKTVPSNQNLEIAWIFSSSLTYDDLRDIHEQVSSKENNSTFRISIVGRQVEKKGTGLVIKALTLIDLPIHLDVIGDGPDLNRFKELSKTLGVTEKITFHGKVSNESVINIISRSALFVFPTTSSEGFPKVVLEAMACGLPIITTNVSVLPHLIKGSDSGIILEEVSPEAVAEAVTKLFHDYPRRQVMKQNAIAAAKQYSLEKWAEAIAEKINQTFGWEIRQKRPILK